jgi:hypothetical protein
MWANDRAIGRSFGTSFKAILRQDAVILPPQSSRPLGVSSTSIATKTNRLPNKTDETADRIAQHPVTTVENNQD